jgi:hypothetical protein
MLLLSMLLLFSIVSDLIFSFNSMANYYLWCHSLICDFNPLMFLESKFLCVSNIQLHVFFSSHGVFWVHHFAFVGCHLLDGFLVVTILWIFHLFWQKQQECLPSTGASSLQSFSFVNLLIQLLSICKHYRTYITILN